MLFINFQILQAIINKGDNLKDKQAYKKIWTLLVKNVSWEFFLQPVNLYEKKIPIFIGFCEIALQIYREILKKYRKRAMDIGMEFF